MMTGSSSPIRMNTKLSRRNVTTVHVASFWSLVAGRMTNTAPRPIYMAAAITASTPDVPKKSAVR